MNSSLLYKNGFVLTNQTSCILFPPICFKTSLCGSNPSALLAVTMACAKGCSEKFGSGGTGQQFFTAGSV
jgi:hypothetical protein